MNGSPAQDGCRLLTARQRDGQPSAGFYNPRMGLVADDAGGVGVPVVCLPMLGMSRVATALAFGPALASGSGVHEVYLDLPGHGDAPGDGAATSQAVLDSVIDWLERHLERPALLAGASYGAYLAAGIARKRPELVGGLVLVCPGVRVGAHERDLPTQEPPVAEPGWLDAAPAELHGHLDRALGHRTRAVVGTVLHTLAAGGPGDEKYQDALTDGPGYALTDQDDEVVFDGPVTMLAGRHDRVVGYSDQFHALRGYPRATYSVLDAAGHYLPFEQPELLRRLTQDWLRRCGT
jgi:pimeloyl-ACP methyl ester carboxylesterase